MIDISGASPYLWGSRSRRLSVALRPKSTDLFHPAVAAWFEDSFGAPTPAQARAWPAIKAGRHTLVAAPTGSGKTLAAFLAAIDSLVRQGVEGNARRRDAGRLCLAAEGAVERHPAQSRGAAGRHPRDAAAQGLPDVDIRAWVRTGDTPAAERDRMRRRPPHIVVTTPESLYILLGSESGRKMLATTRTVIVDEIHAVAPNKRGAHLALSLERLRALVRRRAATDRPVGHPEADRDGRPFPGRRRLDEAAGLRDHRHRPYPRPRPRPRSPVLAARSRDVGGGLGAGLRPARRVWSRRIARRWCSSTPGGWPSGSRGNCPNASAKIM